MYRFRLLIALLLVGILAVAPIHHAHAMAGYWACTPSAHDCLTNFDNITYGHATIQDEIDAQYIPIHWGNGLTHNGASSSLGYGFGVTCGEISQYNTYPTWLEGWCNYTIWRDSGHTMYYNEYPRVKAWEDGSWSAWSG